MSAGGTGWLAVLRRCAVTVGSALTRLVRPLRNPTHHPWLPPPRTLAIAAAAVLAVLGIGSIAVDAAAIEAVKRVPRFIVGFFDEITDYGKSGWFLWPLGILFLFLAALPRTVSPISQQVLAALMVRVGFLFVAVAAPGLFVTTVKRMIGRARPLVGGSLDPYLFEPFNWTASFASLPSGHATTAFSVLAAFGSIWPRGRTILLIYALLILASRVLVTAHYPTDVVAGALVGVFGVLIVRRWFALQRLGFAVGPDGRLRQFPGPSGRRIKSVARELLA